MACFYPLDALKVLFPDGPKILFVGEEYVTRYPFEKLKLPCGQCIGCRLERSRQWAIRCFHEAKLYKENCFITLTYNDDWIPYTFNREGTALATLDPDIFTKFMKRLRKRFGNGIRYFQCGEYGELFDRPHHHVCLFNFDFPDKVLWRLNHEGDPMYRSPALERLWTDPKTGVSYGFSSVAELTFKTAAYTARYILKKVNGERKENHYDGRQSEYVTMSRRPGIGKAFYEKYKDDMYNYDMCVVRNNFVAKPPKYYDALFDIEHSDQLEIIKQRRKEAAQNDTNNTPDRLKTREQVIRLRAKKLHRSFENGS